MKILFLVILTLSLSLVSPCPQMREFTTNFFQTIKGRNWTLSENCFGPLVETEFNQIKEALNKNDLITAYLLFSKLLDENKRECPVDDVNALVSDVVTQFYSGELQRSIQKNFLEILRLFNESEATKTPAQFGKLAGTIVNIVLYNQAHNGLIFLESSRFLSSDPKEDFELFFRGLLEGVSKVPFEENKCYNTLDSVLVTLKGAVQKLYEAIKTRSNFTEAVKTLIEVVNSLKDYSGNCHFTELAKTLAGYSNPFTGIYTLLYNISTHGSEMTQLVKDLYNSVRGKNFNQAGVVSGKITKILLAWETE